MARQTGNNRITPHVGSQTTPLEMRHGVMAAKRRRHWYKRPDMVRIPSGGVSGRNPFGPTWATGKRQPIQQTVGQQVQDSLFGKPKPPVLDQDDADTAALMARLHGYKGRIARLAGDTDDDYRLLLSEGTIAMIDQDGTVYVGRSFLLDFAEDLAVQVGVLAHEIGHRPKRWAEYQQTRELTRDERDQLCRTEETRADYFSGVALAELGLPFQPLAVFLKHIQARPHPEYFDAAFRAQVIEEGFNSGRSKADLRRKMFPELARMHGARGDLGEG